MILEKIPVDGQATISKLAEQSGIPENKLLRILRLTACEQILEEVGEGVFCHTALSEALVKDDKFKAFIEFQCGSSLERSLAKRWPFYMLTLPGCLRRVLQVHIWLTP